MRVAGALVGALVGGGVCLAWCGVVVARPLRLADALRRLDEPLKQRRTVKYQYLIDRLSSSRLGLFKESDLAILGLTRTEVIGSTTAVFAVAAAGVLIAGGALAGGVLPMGTMGFLAVAGFMAALVVVKVLGVASSAAKRRKEARAAITVWLNFVALAVTFHPVEASIRIACNAGDTWTFEAMRAALEEARIRKLRVWDALIVLGKEWELRELSDIGVALSHASLQGAQVREALIAKAETLTARSAADDLGEANKGTAKLEGPIAVTTVSMFVLLLYPAMIQFTEFL